MKKAGFGHHRNSCKCPQVSLTNTMFCCHREQLERVQLPVKIAGFGRHKSSLKCPQGQLKYTWILVTTKTAGNVPRSPSNLPRRRFFVTRTAGEGTISSENSWFWWPQERLEMSSGCLKKNLVLVTQKWLAMVRLPVKYSRLWWPQKRLETSPGCSFGSLMGYNNFCLAELFL